MFQKMKIQRDLDRQRLLGILHLIQELDKETETLNDQCKKFFERASGDKRPPAEAELGTILEKRNSHLRDARIIRNKWGTGSEFCDAEIRKKHVTRESIIKMISALDAAPR